MFDVAVPEYGTMMTLPFGAKTPPKNLAVPEPPKLTEFETTGGFVNGLYCMMFEFVPGIPTTFPFGKRTAPAIVPSFPTLTMFEKVPSVGL